MRLKLRFGGQSAIVAVPEPHSVDAVKAIAAQAFQLECIDTVSLFAGFPPFGALCSAGDVRDGSLVEVRQARMSRHSVPADNSCLFTAVAWLLGLACAPGAQRRLVADAVLRDRARWDAATLGREPEAYAAHIARDATWGGGVDLAILAEAHGTELAAVEVSSGTLYVFGEGRGLARRAYLVFDGLHYDALALEAAAAAGQPQRVVAADDAAAQAAAVAFAREARQARRFTDLQSFTLSCVDCAEGLAGEAAARVHAAKTGHTNFAEYA